jgi:hypothetical protein
MSTETVFEKLNKINVNDKTEKKGQFTYLSWAFAWEELKKVDDKATVKVYHNEVTNLPYFGAGSAGILVKVGVTVNGVEHINYLPAMDFKNKAIPEEKVTMMDVNKAIQRATVKAIALHGLGLYIYAGEDLPEGDETKEAKSPVKDKKTTAKKDTSKSSGNSFRNSKKPKEEKPIATEEEL